MFSVLNESEAAEPGECFLLPDWAVSGKGLNFLRRES
jgi:hypothetical protein